MIYIFTVIYLYITYHSIIWLNKNKQLDEKRKIINYILILTMPIIWICFLRFLLKSELGSNYYPDKKNMIMKPE